MIQNAAVNWGSLAVRFFPVFRFSPNPFAPPQPGPRSSVVVCCDLKKDCPGSDDVEEAVPLSCCEFVKANLFHGSRAAFASDEHGLVRACKQELSSSCVVEEAVPLLCCKFVKVSELHNNRAAFALHEPG